MSQLIIEIDDRDLQELIRRLDNPRPAFQDVGEYMLLRTHERFDRQIDPHGRAWHPLKAATLRQKQKKGQILKILQRTGDLRGTIIYKATRDRLQFGTNRIYGKFHQLARDPNRLREWLPIGREDRREIVAIFESFLVP